MAKEFIAFPELNLRFTVSPTLFTFDLFGMTFSINWYGLLIATGFLLAVIYALKRAKYFKIDPDRMIDVALVSALFAFVGARLYYVLFSSERAQYFENPLSIFYVWEGGLGIYGGIIFAFIAGMIMCRIRKVDVLSLFDLASLGFLIGQAIGRWGNFFNQEAFGGNTTLPWGMTGSIIQRGINGSGYNLNQPVHPTFLYESLWCLLGLLVLHIISKKAYKFKGEIFSLYIMWYGTGRFFIEGLRTDSLYFGQMRVSQLVAVLSVIGGLALFFLFRAKDKALPKDLFAEEELETVMVTDDGDNCEEAFSADETDMTPIQNEEILPETEEIPCTQETANTDTSGVSKPLGSEDVDHRDASNPNDDQAKKNNQEN